MINLLDYSIENKDIFLIIGPTGTGKTNYSILLAKEINAEIINCDLSQIYQPIRIGVGMIEEEERQGIKHYLFGFLDSPLLISVYQMRSKIELLIRFILKKGKKVIIVGGSVFCFYSLFFVPQSIGLNFYSDGNLEIEKLKASSVFQNSYQDKKKNGEIFFFPRFNYTLLFLDIKTKDYWLSIIKRRIDGFFLNGWREEIVLLSEEWKNFIMHKKMIGYNDLLNFINNNTNLTIEEVKERIFYRTAQYGKRQRTFIRKLKRDLLSYSTEVKCIDIFL